MAREVRTDVIDTDLKLEAYQYEGIMQKFPNHFHESMSRKLREAMFLPRFTQPVLYQSELFL